MAEKPAEKKIDATPETPRLVRATRMVFYGGMRIRPGKTFTLMKPSTEFSENAMVYVEAGDDDTAKAVEASPKSRGSAGVTLKHDHPSTQAVRGSKPHHTDDGI